MRKLLLILLFLIAITGVVEAQTTFFSGQVGSSPQDGYVLQTDGTSSTWVATSTLGITGGGGGSDAFTADTNYGIGVAATNTPIWLQGNGTYSVFASSTAILENASTTGNITIDGIAYINDKVRLEKTSGTVVDTPTREEAGGSTDITFFLGGGLGGSANGTDGIATTTFQFGQNYALSSAEANKLVFELGAPSVIAGTAYSSDIIFSAKDSSGFVAFGDIELKASFFPGIIQPASGFVLNTTGAVGLNYLIANDSVATAETGTIDTGGIIINTNDTGGVYFNQSPTGTLEFDPGQTVAVTPDEEIFDVVFVGETDEFAVFRASGEKVVIGENAGDVATTTTDGHLIINDTTATDIALNVFGTASTTNLFVNTKIDFANATGTQTTVGNLYTQGNTIASTNTNGNINITPNGTGDVVIEDTWEFDGNNLDKTSGAINFQFGGNRRYTLSSGSFRVRSNGSIDPQINREDPSDTNPVYTYNGDEDTGIGHFGTNALSLIAGALEGIRISSNTSVSTTTIQSDHFLIPVANDPEITTEGQIAIDGTNSATSSIHFKPTTGSEKVLYSGRDSSMVLASTTLSYIGSYGTAGSSTITFLVPVHPKTVLSFHCKTDTGTAFARVGDGTSWFGDGVFDTICDSDGENNSVGFAYSWNALETMVIEVGNQSGDPNLITISMQLQDDAV